MRAQGGARAAKLVALGWPSGVLPSKKVIKEHVLARVEWEYSEQMLVESLCGCCEDDEDNGDWRDDDPEDYDLEDYDSRDYDGALYTINEASGP